MNSTEKWYIYTVYTVYCKL